MLMPVFKTYVRKRDLTLKIGVCFTMRVLTPAGLKKKQIACCVFEA